MGFLNVLFVIFAYVSGITMATRAITARFSFIETEEELLIGTTILFCTCPRILDAIENAVIIIILKVFLRMQHLLSVILLI